MKNNMETRQAAQAWMNGARMDLVKEFGYDREEVMFMTDDEVKAEHGARAREAWADRCEW